MSLLDQAKDVMHDGVIAAEDFEALVVGSGQSQSDVMLQLIELAKPYSQSDMSDFKVGACGLGSSGALYIGANFEFEGCSLNQAVHAEQATVMNAAIHGEVGLQRLAVSAAPCGFCRQFLNELSTADSLLVSLNGKPDSGISHYLPDAFGPRDLGVEAGMLSPVRHKLMGTADSDGAQAALERACQSYAPYTKAFAGAAVTTAQGRVFSAMYLENAAFNPSMPPLQGAIIAAGLARVGPDQFETIHIAQMRNSGIDHAGAARHVLDNIAPDCTLQTLLLDHGP